jgi:hypothetical protein
MDGEKLRKLAEDIKVNFQCECDPGEDDHGDEVDCDGDCGGDGTGLDGCWWCQATAALESSAPPATPGNAGPAVEGAWAALKGAARDMDAAWAASGTAAGVGTAGARCGTCKCIGGEHAHGCPEESAPAARAPSLEVAPVPGHPNWCGGTVEPPGEDDGSRCTYSNSNRAPKRYFCGIRHLDNYVRSFKKPAPATPPQGETP